MRHVVFRIGSERYGLLLGAVHEVVPRVSMSRVPRAPASVWGIMNLRGRVITVADLGALLGVRTERPLAEEPYGRVVLLEQGHRDLGLLVSDIDGIYLLEEVVPAPGKALASIRGVAHHPGGAVTVLDAEGLEKQIVALLKERRSPIDGDHRE